MKPKKFYGVVKCWIANHKMMQTAVMSLLKEMSNKCLFEDDSNIFFLFKDQNENFFSRGLNTKQGYPKTEILINGKIDPCLDKFKVIYTGDEDILMAINRCYDPFDVEDFK